MPTTGLTEAQSSNLRKHLWGAILGSYLIAMIAVLGGLYLYSQSQSDFHQGSCKGRLTLKGLLHQSLDAAKEAPPEAFTFLSKEQTLKLYRADLDYLDVSDCSDVPIPPPPTIPSPSTG